MHKIRLGPAEYWVPDNDTGIGFHASSGGQQHYAGTAWDNWAYDRLLPYYKDIRRRYGAPWWKFLGDGSEGSVMNAKALVDAGMMPICRHYKEAPHFWFVVDWNTIKAYSDVGCVYHEFGNEPNLGLEVQGVGEGKLVYGHDKVVALGWQIVQNITQTARGGGVCVLPAMAPGDVLDDTSTIICTQSVIKWLQGAKFNDGKAVWDWFVAHCMAGHVAVGGHFRGGNHAVVRANGEVILDYPNDPVNQWGEQLSEEDAQFHGLSEIERQLMNKERLAKKKDGTASLWNDSTSYQCWELVDDLWTAALGFPLPILETEAGPEPYELWEGRYPRTTLQAHAMISMEMVRQMNPEYPKAVRQSLFCRCFWIFDNDGHGKFRAAAWKNNAEFGIDLPALAELEQEMATAPFVRDFAEPPPTPEPTPEPIPTPDPTPVPTVRCRVFDRTGKQLGAFNSAENALNMATTNDGYIQPYGAQKLALGSDSGEVDALRKELAETQAELVQSEQELGQALTTISKVREVVG